MTQIKAPPDPGDDWDALQAAWRAAPAPSALQADLQARVQREKRRLRIEIAIEVISTVAVVALLGRWALSARGVELAILITLMIVAVASVWAMQRWRRALWVAKGETLADHIAFLRKRATLGLWIARLGYASGPIGVALGLALGSFNTAFIPEDDPSIPIVIGLAVTAIPIASVWYALEARRCRRMLAEIATQSAALEEPD